MLSSSEAMQSETGKLDEEALSAALQSSVDLRAYSTEIEEQLTKEEQKCIDDYIGQSHNIAALHNQIVDCDLILERMERMLVSFQSDLGNISSEILALQQQSVQMNLRLTNRQAVQKDLTSFVKDLVISEHMIITIVQCSVTEDQFLEQALALDEKIGFLKEQSFREARSCNDVKDVVDKLKVKAIAKMREFFLEKISSFRRPMTNYHIPQNTMLKFKFYYRFLLAHCRMVAQEVRDSYVETMGKILFSYFKSYSNRLLKLQYQEVATRDDLMGVDTTLGRSFFGKNTAVKSKASVFSMGERIRVIDQLLEAPIIVPHAQHKIEAKYPFEVLFRSEQFGLLENACRESVFVTELFMLEGAEAQELFNHIFGRTMNLLLKNVESAMGESYDSIALVLCLQLTKRFLSLCHEKGVRLLDKYWEQQAAIFMNRLKVVIQLNAQSIRDFDITRVKAADQRPHFVTRRYAEYAAGVLRLLELEGASNNDGTRALLTELQRAVEQLIQRISTLFSDKRSQLVFLINNYDMIIAIISEHSRESSETLDSFRSVLDSRTREFINLVLHSHFPSVMALVQDLERNATSNEAMENFVKRTNVNRVLNEFNSSWKQSLDGINKDILGSFPNFKNGTNILQLTLTQFVQVYHRFHKILENPAVSIHTGKQQVIDVHQLMIEVKKYKPSF